MCGSGIAAAGMIGGAMISSSGAKSAAKTAAKASDRAAQVQWDMYAQSRDDAEPWRIAGETALGRLEELSGVTMDPYYSSPSKRYRMAEALGAIGTSPVAGRLAPHQLGGALNLVSRHADTEWQNDLSRLATLAGYGPEINQYLAGQGQAAAGQAGNAMMNAGMARAQGKASQYNNMGNMLSQGLPLAYQAYQNWQAGPYGNFTEGSPATQQLYGMPTAMPF